MLTTYYPHMHRQHIHTPLTPKLLHNPLAPMQMTYPSLVPSCRNSFFPKRSTGVQYPSEPHGGTTHTVMIRELSKVLMSSRMRGAVLSWCLPLCPSTSSCRHIAQCTYLTGWLFLKPQCPLPRHSLWALHQPWAQNHHIPPTPPAPPSPVGLRSVSESATSDL